MVQWPRNETLHPRNKGKAFEHEVILYCKANPDVKIITAIDVLLKDERLSGAYKLAGYSEELFATALLDMPDYRPDSRVVLPI